LIIRICHWDHIFFSTVLLAAVSNQVYTAKMDLSDVADLEDYVCRPDKISATDVELVSWHIPRFLCICCFLSIVLLGYLCPVLAKAVKTMRKAEKVLLIAKPHCEILFQSSIILL
jgi:hypothetical protein